MTNDRAVIKADITRFLEITGITKYKFCIKCGISTSSLDKIFYDKYVSSNIINKVYSYMKSAPKELSEFVCKLNGMVI